MRLPWGWLHERQEPAGRVFEDAESANVHNALAAIFLFGLHGCPFFPRPCLPGELLRHLTSASRFVRRFRLGASGLD
jgi:hypothetical protein